MAGKDGNCRGCRWARGAPAGGLSCVREGVWRMAVRPDDVCPDFSLDAV